MSPLPLRRSVVPLLALGLAALHGPGGRPAADAPQGPPGVAAAAGYGHLPVVFVENGGQAAGDASHVAPGRSASFLFGPGGVGMRLWRPPGEATCPGQARADGLCLTALGQARPPDPLAAMAPGTRAGGPERGTVEALELAFVGARAGLRAEGRAPARGRVSYFHGPEAQWRRGLRTYRQLVYRDVWPGIDVVYDGGLDQLKHSFVVRPGADPGRIRLAWRGASGLAVNGAGDLVVGAPGGEVIDAAPVAFQEAGGRRVAVAASYALGPAGSAEYGFQLGHVDPRATLVIDPAMLVYASFLGAEGEDRGLGIEVDEERSAYLTGNQGPDAFVAKLSPDGTELVYLAVVGGDGLDTSFDIDVDPRGAAYFTGATTSLEDSFPLKGGPDRTLGGAVDALVAKLSPDGQDLVYAGYLGGAGVDFGEALVVDEDGNAYTSGDGESSEATFPVVVGPDLTHNGQVDAYVAKIKAEPFAEDPRDNLHWAGFVGGRGHDVAILPQYWSAGHMAIDEDRNVYISNQTTSDERSFPDGDGFGALASFDPTHNGGWDAYVAKVRADGTGLAYAGYLGGADRDEGKGMAVDRFGAAYLTGGTNSGPDTFPVKVGPDLTYNGRFDGFVAKVAPDGRRLEYCGYLGGDDDDSGQAVALGPEPEQALYVTGWSESTEGTFPVTLGPDLTHNGPFGLGEDDAETDAFVGRLARAPEAADPRRNWDFLGFVGGAESDPAFWLDVDDRGDVYLAGDTLSGADTFPDGGGMTGLKGLGQAPHGDQDAFVAKVSFRPPRQGQTALLPSLGKAAARADLVAGAPAAPSHTPEPIATRTVTPPATPTRLPPREYPVPADEELLLYDDFADEHSGWAEVDEGDTSVQYADGALELTAGANLEAGAEAPMQDWGDGALEVTGERLNDGKGSFVIYFGPGLASGFLFIVFASGDYVLVQQVGDGGRTLIPLSRAAPYKAGREPNRFRLERYGGTLVILVNGEHVRTFSHPDLAERGGLTLAAAADAGGPLALRLDDFLLTRWAPGRPTPTTPPTATRAPTRTPTSTPKAGDILFQDDFSNPAGGWRVQDDANETTGYVGGEYGILVHKPQQLVAPFAPGVSCADCTVEVTARFESGVLGASGLLMGERNVNDAVLFEVISDGRYAVERLSGGAWETLVPYTTSSAIKKGAGQVNRLKAVREGGKLSMFVNGTALRTIDAPGLANAGRVGLVAICGPAPEFSVRYDDFVVRAGAVP